MSTASLSAAEFDFHLGAVVSGGRTRHRFQSMELVALELESSFAAELVERTVVVAAASKQRCHHGGGENCRYDSLLHLF